MIVAKLDRVARKAEFFQTVQNQMGAQGAVFCDMPNIDATGPNGRFTIGIMAQVAELEAALISDRTKKALAAAKARGVKLGRQSRQPAQEQARREAQHPRAAGEGAAAEGRPR